MTLTTRLSVFFLTTLAIVLAGFSGALYFLAKDHLRRQVEDHLDAVLNTLAAAAEVSPEGVEWEPSERQLRVPPYSGEDILWLVSDPAGRAVDLAASADATEFLGEAAEHLRSMERTSKRLEWSGGRWLFRQQWVRADNRDAPPQPRPDDGGRRYPQLSFVVGASLEPMQATLRNLAWTLAALSLGIWSVALFAGRFVCRRALMPVSRMASSARGMDATDLGQRLPSANTGDELEDLGRAFNSLLDRLQESFERQRRFTGDASHQLRTPLTAMLGQVEVALRRQRPVEEYERVLTSVRQQADRLRQIVESLLFLARADADARLPERAPVDLREWLPGHLHAWAGHPRADDFLVEAYDVGPAWAEVQPILLGELLNILLDNACKYSEPATPITLKLCRAGDAVQMAVQDRGSGIADEDMPHVFRPFFRSATAHNRGVEGLGLGLAIARRLAAALGGSIAVTSQVGKGACFIVSLPVAEAHPTTSASAASSVGNRNV